MKRDSQKSEDHLKDLQDDIQFLLSNIRARQNGLIFFLERFTGECKFAEQLSVFKEQFMQKEKIYSSQVARIVNKYTVTHVDRFQQQVRTFWIKVKSIVKVSLDRLRILSLLNEKIFTRYEEIIALINNNYDQQKGIEEFISVENLLKKRNVDALIFGKGQFSSHNSQAKMTKNRSESTLKQSKFSPKQKPDYDVMMKLDFDRDDTNEIRMKSLNGIRKKKVLIESKAPKNNQKTFKKMMRSLQKYQRGFENVMPGSVDVNYDRKKTVKENQQAIYDDIFKKNIPNHKMISKFIFKSCGITNLLVKKPAKLKLKKLIVKLEQKDSKEITKLNKTKPTKEPRQRHQSSQNMNFRMTEEERKKIVQTVLTDKKGKYRKKVVGRVQKYNKLLKLIS